ncbi:hypothetical protein TNCV_3032361 [Trichonephila clavipes]|nr:hypothetical protein TNCV_3032361 [Trichonephila clavipes]
MIKILQKKKWSSVISIEGKETDQTSEEPAEIMHNNQDSETGSHGVYFNQWESTSKSKLRNSQSSNWRSKKSCELEFQPGVVTAGYLTPGFIARSAGPLGGILRLPLRKTRGSMFHNTTLPFMDPGITSLHHNARLYTVQFPTNRLRVSSTLF